MELGSGSPRAFERVVLEPDLRSAALARQVLRAMLGTLDDEGWLEVAELACTELISNAVLHAHTRIELTVDLGGTGVRVGVRDFSPLLPLPRSYDAQATTGRGLALVAALTSEHGVDVAADGKTVWFTVDGHPAEQAEQDVLDAWADADWDLDEDAPVSGPASDSASAASRTVQLLGLPPTLWLAAREHHDALIRELVLYVAAHDDVQVDVSGADQARGTISAALLEALHERGQEPTAPLEPLDLALQVPAGLGAAYRALQVTLDAAEALAGADRLLVRPGRPEVIAVRDWACEQVVTQLAGGAPSPWAGPAQEWPQTAGPAVAAEPAADGT